MVSTANFGPIVFVIFKVEGLSLNDRFQRFEIADHFTDIDDNDHLQHRFVNRKQIHRNELNLLFLGGAQIATAFEDHGKILIGERVRRFVDQIGPYFRVDDDMENNKDFFGNILSS